MDLNQITVPVNDVAQSIDFYQGLGLELIVKALPHYARFKCQNGTASFSLHLAEERGIGEKGIWVYFEIEDLDKRVDELINDGFEFDELPNDKPWLWREARLKDPDGNLLILYYAGVNRLDPPWKIT